MNSSRSRSSRISARRASNSDLGTGCSSEVSCPAPSAAMLHRLEGLCTILDLPQVYELHNKKTANGFGFGVTAAVCRMLYTHSSSCRGFCAAGRTSAGERPDAARGPDTRESRAEHGDSSRSGVESKTGSSMRIHAN